MSNKECAAHKLPWSGLFSREQRNRLKAELPSFIICPGYTGRFGRSDEAGMLYVMGASGGYTDAKRTLRSWHGKQQDPNTQWWLVFIKEQSIEPITTHEVLDGISYSRWATYSAAYKKASALERMRRYTARRRAQVIQEKEHDHDVARQLLGLGQGGASNAASNGE